MRDAAENEQEYEDADERVTVETQHYYVGSRVAGTSDQSTLDLGCTRCTPLVWTVAGREPVVNGDVLLAIMHAHERGVHR